MFDMTAPVTLPSADRLNAGEAYVVRVQLKAGRWFLEDDRVTVTPPADGSPADGSPADWLVNWGSAQGTVTPDGSLSVEPEPWAARHYRRAVMRGAGVYRWGLWAAFGGTRPGAQPDAQAGAALGVPVNGPEQLDGFSPWGVAPRFTPPPTAVSPPRVSRDALAQGLALLERVVPLRLPFLELLEAALGLDAPSPRAFDPSTGSAGFLLGAAQSLAHRAAAALLPQGRKHRAQRRAFWAAIRAALRVLRRMLPRVRRPRSTCPAPRPLHARPRPPAAPLAPPALA